MTSNWWDSAVFFCCILVMSLAFMRMISWTYLRTIKEDQKKPAASTRKRRQERGEEDRIPILDRDSARESMGSSYRKRQIIEGSLWHWPLWKILKNNIGKEGEKSSGLISESIRKSDSYIRSSEWNIISVPADGGIHTLFCGLFEKE
jgi:hypothetical protein